MSRPTQLRVGVSLAHVRLPASSGAGRMWRNVTANLAELMHLGYWGDPHRSRFRRPPDVWLHDGHVGPLGVPEPVVVHIQEANWHDESHRPLFEPWFIEKFAGPSRAAAESADAVITPSASSRAQILENYSVDPARVHTVPLGVDLALFRPARPGAEALIAQAGGDPSRPYILFVSTLHPRKNLEALRQAVAGLARRGLPHSLVIAASPPVDRLHDLQPFRDAAAELPGAPGRVVVLRDLSDVQLAAVMAGASVFCLPSLMEGFGLTALEAMACGVPVVVSSCGSLPEVVGDAGVVSDPTAEALESALHDLLEDSRHMAALRRAGLERSLGFTWRATAQGWCQVLSTTVPAAPVGRLEQLLPASGPLGHLARYGPRIPIRRRRWARPLRSG